MERHLNNLTYGIVGLGIMGGSFAKAIRTKVLSEEGSKGRVFACNRSTASLEIALKEGVIDRAFKKDEVREMLPLCDVTFISLYPRATLDFLLTHKNDFKEGSIVTDISGVKGIFKEKENEILGLPADFIIGHPMAGGEKEGYAFSNAEYFTGHNYILIPSERNKPENISLFESLISSLGFSRITKTTIDTHDEKIGFTSQLCHVIATSLVDSNKDENITAFGGGSFEDLTRIAMINAPLWSELFLSNREKLLKHIENFEESLEKIKKYIAESDKDSLLSFLENVRERRIKMGSIRG